MTKRPSQAIQPSPPGRAHKGKGKGRDRPPSSKTKKAFDLKRDSVYVADPIADLRICGARGVVPASEAGDLDTAPGPDIPVKDMRRIRTPLSPEFLANIDRRSVRTSVIIAKIDNVATVLAGKRRVRAARASNRKRARDGRPLMKIRCIMQRDVSELAILQVLIDENNARLDDSLADKVEKLKRFLKEGPSEADAAIEFCVSIDRIREWLAYDDHATDAVKAAVEAGLPASTGLELAKIKDVERQIAALDKILAGPGVRDRSARTARALAQGANDVPTATDRKSQRMLLAYLQAPERQPKKHTSVADREFWRGAIETLKAVTGQEADPIVTRAIAEARSLGKAPVDAPVDANDGTHDGAGRTTEGDEDDDGETNGAARRGEARG